MADFHFSGVKMTVDKLPDLYLALRMLGDRRILAGIPAERVNRQDGKATNAEIGYINETGDPAARIPARPFLAPAVAAMQSDIVEYLKRAGELALKGDPAGTDRTMHALGLLAQNRIRAFITAGIAPPLATSTLRQRIAARTAIAGAKAELRRRFGGGTPGIDLAKPLIATGQLRNSITYVIRSWVSGRDLRVGKDGSWDKWYSQFTK